MSMFVLRRNLVATSALALTLLVASHAVAQQRPAAPAGGAVGRISGKVIGPDRQPVTFANVIVLGTKQGTATDENGAFVIAGVPVGTQQIKVQAIGFDAKIEPVTVNAGQTATVNFALGEQKVSKVLEEIEVRAEKRIDTKSSQSVQSISAEKFKELPVDNLQQAVATKAGVVARTDGLHVRGGRAGEVKFQYDGVEASDPLFGGGANIASLAVAGTDIL